MDPIVALASSHQLPEPVHRGGHLSTPKGELNRAKHLQPVDNGEQYAISPYQALPITGPVLPPAERESKSTSLPIQEPDLALSSQVGSGCCVCECVCFRPLECVHHWVGQRPDTSTFSHASPQSSCPALCCAAAACGERERGRQSVSVSV